MTDLALSTQNFRPSASTRAVVVGAATVFALSSCESDLDASQVALEEHVQRQSPAQIIEDGVFHYTERGALVNVLEATRIERWEPQDASTPEVWVVDNGFVLYIGGGEYDHQAALSATRGTYDDVHGHLEAWEHVELVNASGTGFTPNTSCGCTTPTSCARRALWKSPPPKGCFAGGGSRPTAGSSGTKSWNPPGRLTSDSNPPTPIRCERLTLSKPTRVLHPFEPPRVVTLPHGKPLA